jgi:hypothetical protein
VKNKLMLLTGAAVGYVLGTRAGREQYEKIRAQAKTLWNDPKVQEQVSQAQATVKEQAPVVQEKVAEAARSTADRAKSATGRDQATVDPVNESGGGI